MYFSGCILYEYNKPKRKEFKKDGNNKNRNHKEAVKIEWIFFF